MPKPLTIAIPTYNRSTEVVSLLRSLQISSERSLFDIVILDDGSKDDTLERLHLVADGETTILSNDHNMGYARSFSRLLSYVDTGWVMMSSDDDLVNTAHLSELLDWLYAEGPEFVATQWHQADGTLYRGRPKFQPIRPADLRSASNHAPGLVYRCDVARGALALLDRSLAAGSAASHNYPQVVVAAQLIAGGKAMFCPLAVVSEGANLPSGLVDLTGKGYDHPSSRLEQSLAFDELFRLLNSEARSFSAQRRTRTLVRTNKTSIYYAARRYVCHQFPDLATEGLLDESALHCAPRMFAHRHAGVRTTAASTRNLIKSTLRFMAELRDRRD